jgi:SMI1 / KNR4 family (SUKH-1)
VIEMASQFRAYFEALVRHAILRDRESRFRYSGFTEKEVDFVEEEWGRQLPSAYRDFLLVMGRRAGRAFEYVTMSFDGPIALLDFQRHANELIAECGVGYHIPIDAFFCANYLDSQLSFFDVDLNEDDPSLFDFEIGNPKQPATGHSLTTYIEYILGRER